MVGVSFQRDEVVSRLASSYLEVFPANFMSCTLAVVTAQGTSPLWALMIVPNDRMTPPTLGSLLLLIRTPEGQQATGVEIGSTSHKSIEIDFPQEHIRTREEVRVRACNRAKVIPGKTLEFCYY